ncbi:hypothetical protein CesoFtcFv8_024938 [Champsocephalus esox]|uniref:YqaJ viral recombinase domain-containing protein n=1 Tax=Champsocephalus esox TaxID=159716 RepID=A0AAN8B2W0_9TELE|nr:hypothetical protein CesoFtcFv8_024938 [Champsocephalus esox]
MAGLSESCSHVGEVLFAIEAGVKMRETASCTTEKCKWLMPSHVKKIPAAPVAMIDFSSAKSKKQKLDDAIAGRTEAHKFSTAATRYGCKYEATARKQYEGVQSLHHQGFSCKDSGLWLNPQWPYMGASPDGCVTCTCHGTGICEIKCPHSKQEEANLRLCAGEQGFCLVNDCEAGQETCLLPSKRIVRDVDLWDNIIPRVESFFRLCVLPEVLGQKLTRGKFQLQDDQEGEKA